MLFTHSMSTVYYLMYITQTGEVCVQKYVLKYSVYILLLTWGFYGYAFLFLSFFFFNWNFTFTINQLSPGAIKIITNGFGSAHDLAQINSLIIEISP